MAPSVAAKYLVKVVKDFEKFAADHYVPALKTPDVNMDLLLGAARFIETRRVSGHETHLREAFSTNRKERVSTEFAEACVDALLATTENPAGTAGFLAIMATLDRPVVSAFAEAGMRRLGPTANDALLKELTKMNPPVQLRKLARLLAEISKVKSPKPITFWQKATEVERQAVVDEWRRQIAAKGGLP